MTGRRHALHGVLAAGFLLALAVGLTGAAVAQTRDAETGAKTTAPDTVAKHRVVVRGGEHDGFGRLVFDWPHTPGYALRRDGADMVITFEAPADFDLSPLDHDLEGYLGRARVEQGGTVVRLPLTAEVQLKHFMIDSKVVVDLIDSPNKTANNQDPEAAAAPPPTAPAAPEQPAAQGPTVPVRVGEHPGFSRLVFDWPAPVPYAVEQSAGQITVRFGQSGRLDLSRMRADPPPEVAAAVTRALPDGTAVDLAVAADARVRHYASAGQVVIDVLGAGTAVDARAAKIGEPVDQLANARPSTVTPPAAPALATAPDAESASPGTAQPDTALAAGAPPQPAHGEDRGSAPQPTTAAPDDAAAAALAAGPTFLLPSELGDIEPAAGEPAEAPEAVPETDAAAAANGDTAPAAAATIALPAEPEAAPVFASGREQTAQAAPEDADTTAADRDTSAAHAPTLLNRQAADSGAAGQPDASGPQGRAHDQVATARYDDAFISANDPPAPTRRAPILGAKAAKQQQIGLRFNWNEPVGAAVFRRGPFMWLVFDREARAPIAANIEKVAPELAPVRRLRQSDATVIRMTAPVGLVPKLVPAGSSWLLHMLRTADHQTDGLTLAPVATIKGLQVHVPIESVGEVVTIQDPDVGDRLHVVTLPTPDLGLERGRTFPQFRALASYQGLVVQPLSDQLRLEPVADGIVISTPEGLFVSSEEDIKTTASSRPAPDQRSRLFDLVAWRRGDIVDYGRNRQALLRVMVEADERTRGLARLDLARFYFAHGLANEALGIIDAIAENHPILSGDPQVILLRGASQVLSESYGAAAETLAHPALSHEWEAELWRAALDAARHDWDSAARRFFESEPLMADYAKPIRFGLRLLAAEARLGVADTGGASQYLNGLLRGSPNPIELAQINVLKARQLYQDRLKDEAKAMWQAVTESDHAPSRARARLALIDVGEDEGELTPAEVIDALERLRFSWRGDEFEFSILTRLGDLYAKEGHFRKALLALRQAASHLPDSPRAAGVADRMREIFGELYLEGGNKAMSPVAALALYEEFRELTPAGVDGDTLIAGLADRLVEVDLLDEAARLLNRQIEFRLSGEEKARIGARVALLRLLDKRPQDALDTLAASTADDLPPELAQQRRHLKARALSESEQETQALALLEGDESHDALRLRADVLWTLRDWPEVATLLERLVPDGPTDETGPDADQADAIVRLAIAYTLEGNRNGLYDLGWRYGPTMAGTPHAATFEMLTGDLDAVAITSVADELAHVETIQAFLSSYKQRIQTGSLSSIN